MKQTLTKKLRFLPLRWQLGAFLLLSASLLATTVPANPATAIENAGIGGRPANPDPANPRTSSIFVYSLAGGAVKEDAVNVINNSGQPKTLSVYATDASESADKTFACKQASEEVKAVGTYIKLAASEVTLESGETMPVPFTLTLPPDAQPGEQNGCIAIEEKVGSTNNQSGVRLSLRSALRVAITVPGDLRREISILSSGISRKPNSSDYLAQAKVQNTGNVSSDTDIEIVVKGFFGEQYKKFGGQYAIFPGESADYNFDVKQPFFGGFYRAKTVASYSKPDQTGAPVGDKVYVNNQSRLKLLWPTPPGLAIEVGVLLLLAGLLMRIIRRRRTRRRIATRWVEYTVKRGDDIYEIAERHEVSWKLLAKANKLKAPYRVKTGTVLLVPPRAAPPTLNSPKRSSKPAATTRARRTTSARRAATNTRTATPARRTSRTATGRTTRRAATARTTPAQGSRRTATRTRPTSRSGSTRRRSR